MNQRTRLGLARLLVIAGTVVQAAPPELTDEQQARLKELQAKFAPGLESQGSGYGYGKIAEFCGADIPIVLDPSLVALETDKNRKGDRTEIAMTCHAFASAVTYTCGSDPNAEPEVKELVRANVKRMVCRATTNASETNNHGVKYALDNGTLTFTVLARDGRLSGGNIMEQGQKFLSENARRGPDGISIGGLRHKQKMTTDLSLEKTTVRKSLRDECGLEFTVTIDDTLAEYYSHRLGHSAGSACEAGMQVIYNSCGRGDSPEISSPIIKEATKKHLKGISCVLSDQESIAIRPNGILEFGHSLNAPRPLWEGRNQMSIHDYYFNWMKANIKALGSAGGVAPAKGKPTSKPGNKSR